MEKNTGIILLKKGKKGVISIIFSRLGIILLLLLIQIISMFWVFIKFEEFLPHIYGVGVAFSFIITLFMLNSPTDPTAKLTWLMVIMLLPVFGSLLYFYTQFDVGHRKLVAKVKQINRYAKAVIPQNRDVTIKLQRAAPDISNLAWYIGKSGRFPVYQNTDLQYFPSGESMYQELLVQLEKAEKYIYLEFFIIEEGTMWGKVLEILAQKASQGLDVRVLYDGTCEFTTLPRTYPSLLKRLGIHCKMFDSLSPFVSTKYNYRDHRKIVVIDGKTAFNGGVNLADEYINKVKRFGHWKDAAVMLTGEAVRSFTLMFLQMWHMDEKVPDYSIVTKTKPYSVPDGVGYVIPYGDCPLTSEKFGEHVYWDILNHAQNYVYIMTPYLILDGEMETALTFAAERGIDVRIMLPGIPDKFIPYALAFTHYKALLDSGVKLYHYTPGFIHSKVFVCDDNQAVVGTINLDYRSLYHHFECATYMYQTSCIHSIKDDFLTTQKQCTRITHENLKSEPFKRRALGFLLKVIAPLL